MSRNTGPTAATRQAVYDRAGNACERCGRTTGRFAIHHRQPRKAGGTRNPAINDLSNLVLLDEDCHLEIESRRQQAYEAGWLVHSWDDPAQVPITPRSVA